MKTFRWFLLEQWGTIHSNCLLVNYLFVISHSKVQENVMDEHGVNTISEVYDGNPPHLPGGAISQAWSVAEILRIMDLNDQITVKKKFKG